MASLVEYKLGGKRVNWRLFFVWQGQRQSLTLPPVSARDAQAFKIRFEQLLSQRYLGIPLTGPVADWLASLDPKLKSKLVELGIADVESSATVGDLIDAVSKHYATKKRNTRVNVESVLRILEDFFTRKRLLATITRQDAMLIAQNLRKYGNAHNTVVNRLHVMSRVFSLGERFGLLKEGKNPFRWVPKGSYHPTPKRYVTVQEIEKIMEVALNQIPSGVFWYATFGLARFAGLRIPSEIAVLRWEDVDFASGRLTIDSPKTGRRVMPLFPRVREIFERLKPITGMTDKVFPEEWYATWMQKHRHRTAHKIIAEALGQTYGRPFHSLQSSCESDLAASFPIQAVAKWLGNSTMIAFKHYVDTTDTLFKKAQEFAF